MVLVFGNEISAGQEAEQINRLEVQCKKGDLNNLKYYYGIKGKSLLKDRERMIQVLELINQKRLVWKARANMQWEKTLNESVKQIKKWA